MFLDEEKNGYVVRDQLLYALQWRAGHARGLLASAWGHEGTMISQGSCIIYITEKPVRQHVQGTNFGLFVVASLFRFNSWFHIHLFLFI